MKRLFGSSARVSKSQPLRISSADYQYFPITAYEIIKDLPYSVRVLLESAIRNRDDFSVTQKDIDVIVNWKTTSQSDNADIAYKPARVLLQDFTGVPLVADIAAMRDAVSRLGGDPKRVNPLVPIDLVIDHSVQADVARSPDALRRNEQIEMERNLERFEFLKWGAQAFGNMRIVPPGNGIVHQVNLEYLSRIVFNEANGLLYPDSCVGTDSHTPMIAGLGVLGWGVGGIEAESVLLGQPISMVIPQVVGVHLTGNLREGVTSTDLVLSVTELLRRQGVVGKFVEFFGPGCQSLSVPTRATIANMAPEYGATVGFFPFDDKTCEYLRQLGRPDSFVDMAGGYLRANGLSPIAGSKTPEYSSIVELNLGEVVPCVAGPKRPQDRVALTELKDRFRKALTAPNGFQGFGATTVSKESQPTSGTLNHGSVVLAAITSCTNTSNPGVMVAAGLLAKKAHALGLSVPDYVKPVLAPGSKAVSAYLEKAGLMKSLEGLGFYTAGYGCMVCIGNTGDLAPTIVDDIRDNKLVVASVLSGNRNFEGRIHPLTKANYIASPPLVVAYALAGKVDIDFATEPIAVSPTTGQKVFLRDIWPSQSEVDTVCLAAVSPELFTNAYKDVLHGNAAWDSIKTSSGELYPWDNTSTYIRQPPYFDNVSLDPTPLTNIAKARCLLNLGDSVTTDHISPAGSIAIASPTATYLRSKGVHDEDFSIYGCRRGNHEIMMRGTFAHVRLMNKMCDKVGPFAVHVPSGDVGSVFDVAMRYKNENRDAIILAGKEYGTGSSRDWAAKGVQLQGVRAVIAESYERIHRSNLVGMGVLPLQFEPGQSADSLGLTGHEEFSIDGLMDLKPGSFVTVNVSMAGKPDISFRALVRIDTEVENVYFTHGGVLPYVMRQIIQK